MSPDPAPARDHPGGLRRRAVLAARLAFAAAFAVLVVGLLMVLREPRLSTGDAARPSSAPLAAGPGALPTVARIAMSASGTPSSPVVWHVGVGRDGARDAVLLGYQAYLGTVVRLGEDPDPDDVALPQVALDPELALLRRALARSEATGTTRRGRVLATARVTGLHGNEATVVGCVDTAAQSLFGPDGRSVPHWRGALSVSTLRMRRDDGRWKVYLLASLPAARCQR